MMHDEDTDFEHDTREQTPLTDTLKKVKPHVVRRNIEDFLERKALERRLKDVFDDDFLLD